MEYKIDPSGEKNIIKRMAITIVILIVVGAFIIFFNNPEYIFKYNINKINNEFINDLCDKLDLVKKYNTNFNANIDFKYNNEDDVNLYINKSVDNEYNIISINENVYIYEKEGIFYLNIPEISETIQLNKEPIDIDYSAIYKLNSKGVKKVYKKVTGVFIDQMKKNDFYKQKYTYTNNKGKERMAYEYGIQISEVRAKRILLNGFNKLKNDERFLIKLDRVLNKLVDEEQEISSKEIIENIIEQISKYEANENVEIQVVTRNKGIFSLKIDTIKAYILDSDIVIAETNGSVKDGQVELNIVNNKYNNSYNITLKNKKNDKKVIIDFIDSEQIEHKLEFTSLKHNNNEKQSLLLQSGDNSIKYDLTFNNKNYKEGILSKLSKKIDEEIDEDIEEEDKENSNQDIKNDIIGNISINIGEFALNYDIKCDFKFESKKEEADIKRKINIKNLDDEQLGLIGIYFDITAEKLREIIGEQEIIETPTNLAIPTEENKPTNLAIPDNSNNQNNLNASSNNNQTTTNTNNSITSAPSSNTNSNNNASASSTNQLPTNLAR